MDNYKHAALTPLGRERMVKLVLNEGWTKKAAGERYGVSGKTVGKWVERYRLFREQGLKDRSSRPHHCPRQTSSLLVEKVLAFRRLRWNGWRIAYELKLSRATVSRILVRARMNRLRSLDPPPPVQRYEHARPGDMIHFDIKTLARIERPGSRVTGKLGDRARGAGYEYLHVAIDDHSRLAFAAILPDQTHRSAVRFFFMARAYFARFDIAIQRVLSDNGPCYHSRALALTLARHNIRHRFTRPYTPRTNGKAERFIQTALREWAYAHTYQDSAQRTLQLGHWIHRYNFHRPHVSLNLDTPADRACSDRNNLLRLHN